MPSISRHCVISGKRFDIREVDQDFYAKKDVLLPKLSPSERMRRRLAWRNERHLHRRICNSTGSNIISIYPDDTLFPVYSSEAWWSDSWDALVYGRAYNLGRPFVDQFMQLYNSVPRLAIFNRGENSDYCSLSDNFKNSYMCVSGIECEECLFSYFTSYSYQCVDCSSVLNSQFCYECIDCKGLYECRFCQDCDDSRGLLYCKNCIGCEDCIGCLGLHRKKYQIFNNPYTKKEYLDFLCELQPLSRSKQELLERQLEALTATEIFKYYHGSSNENCIGDYISGCRNVYRSFDIHNSEDVAYSHNSPKGLLNSYDSCFSPDGQLLLECISGLEAFEQTGSMYCWNSNNTHYSDHCISCSDVLACVGLRHKQFCILNKQYTEEEYQLLAAKIIENMKREEIWGEFLPASLSPFAYYESQAQDYFPLGAEEATKLGFNWRVSNFDSYSDEKTELPETIAEVSDSILDRVLTCSLTGSSYKLIRHELNYYRKADVPVPNVMPKERMLSRLRMRNPREFFNRRCCISGENLVSTYSPERPEKIASEAAYQDYMFSA